MPDRAFSALFLLEVQRQVGYFTRGGVTMIAVAGLFYVGFGGGSQGVSMAAAFLGFSLAFYPTMNTLPDKLDGTFEFLTSLPVAMDVIAGARISASAAAGFVAAVLWTGAVGYAASGVFGATWGPGSYLLVFLVFWFGATLLSALVSGMIVRFSMESMARFPFIVVGLLVGIPWAVDRWAPGTGDVIAAWLLEPRSPALYAVPVIALEVVGVWVGFHLLRTGLERFRPPAAKIAS